MTIKVLTLCSTYNRKEITLRALRSIQHSAKEADVQLINVVVDDGSVDGTREAIAEEFDDVIQLHTCDLYWAGAMRYGFSVVIDVYDFDYLFAYNDDVDFFPEFFHNFLLRINELDRDAVIVGQTLDTGQSRVTYGGRVRRYFWYPLSFRLIAESEYDSSLATFNMNALFVPREVLARCGFLSEGYIHSGADFDYGLMLRRKGVDIVRLTAPVGVCDVNDTGKKLSFSPSIKRMISELGVKKQPIRQRVLFCKRNGGFFWWAWVFVPYIKAFFWGQRL